VELTSGEIVVGRLNTSDALLETSIASELGAENAVLEARWVLQVDVELAVQSGSSDWYIGADSCDHSIKDEGKANRNVRSDFKSWTVTHVFLSAERKYPTVFCGQPLPPNAMELM
jgi:hypothetical protein